MRTHRRPIRNRKTFRSRFPPQQEDVVTRLELERFRFGSPSDGNGVSRKTEKSLLRKEKGRLATKQDWHERRQYQLTKFLQLREEGHLTPEWKRFGKDHEWEIRMIEREKSQEQNSDLELGLPRKEFF